MTHQPAISFSISIHSPFNRAGGRTSNVRKNMKHTILLLATTLLPFFSAWAQEIQVSTPVLMGKGPVKIQKYDNAAKTWGEVDGFGYSFVVYLKNISEKPLTVVTASLSQQTSPGDPKQEVKLNMEKTTLADGGAVVVPSREDLRLVDIRSGEVAAMKIEFKMAVPLEEITVTYSPKDFYDGRFGYWTGTVSSAPLKIKDKK